MLRSHPALARAGLAAALVLPALAGTACTSSPGGSTTGTGALAGTTAAGGQNGPSTTAASSYPNVAEVAKALNAKGITCQLVYPGIKDDVSQAEVSICTIDDEQAFVRVWQSADLVSTFLATPDGQTGTLAAGANWTISLQTGATASKVAEALGGRVPGAATAASSTTTR